MRSVRQQVTSMAPPTPPASPNRSGRLVVAGYKLREHIASGGQANVYRAKHVQKGVYAAIKIVPCDTADANGKRHMALLMREKRIHETLKHSSVLELMFGEERSRDHAGWPAGLYLVLTLGAYR